MSLARFLPPALVLAMFLLLGLLGATDRLDPYYAILRGFGMYQETPPFLDTNAILSALQCHARGVDVYASNPCDILNRQHVYGSLWLKLAPLGLDPSWTFIAGGALDLLFIAGLFCLPKARRWRDVAIVSLAFLSPAIIFALERANNDLLVWLLALAASRLLLGGAFARGVAYALCMLSALLKFYPAVLLVLLARERLTRAIGIGLGLSAVLLALLWRETSTPLGRFRYTAYMTDAFGAWNVAEAVLATQAGMAWQPMAMLLIVLALTAYAVSLSVRMVTRFGVLARVRALPELEKWLALSGAVMLVACFFTGPSLVYRGVHLLLVLPAVLSLWRSANDRAGAWLFGGVAWVIVWCLWSEAAHNHVMQGTRGTETLDGMQWALIGVVTGLRELAWWWLISVLMALSGCIALTSGAGAELCALLRIRLPG